MTEKKEILKAIVESYDFDKLMDFLKNLPTQDYHSVSLKVKGLFHIYEKEKFECNKENIRRTLKHKLDMLYVAAFVTLDKEKFIFLSAKPGGYKKIIEYNVLEWHHPEWFDKYVKGEPWAFDNYQDLIEMMQDGIINFGKNIIQSILVRGIDIENIPQITTQEHIWYLFEEGSNISHPYEGSWNYMPDWISIFQTLIDTKKIAFLEVIERSLETVHFTPINSFYFDLIYALKPPIKTLLTLQEKLFTVFSQTETKPITITLKLIKQIAKEKQFDLQLMIDSAPLLISSEIKSIRTPLVSILETLIKIHPDQKEPLGLLLTQALVHQDNTLQAKVIKVLIKNKLTEIPVISDALTLYYDSLFHDSQNLLPNFFGNTKIESEQLEIISPQYITPENRIPNHQNFDDIVFFFSQAFDNNNPYDFDLILKLLPELHLLINEHNVDILQQILQKAYKIFSHWDYPKGEVVYVSSLLLLRYGWFLRDKYPSLKIYILNLFEKHDYSINHLYENKERYAYEVFYHLSELVEKNIHIQNNTPLLSSPTHYPCLIDGNVLIDRVAFYEQYNKDIDIYDFQIAINRVDTNTFNLSYIQKTLIGEFKEIFLYLCNEYTLDSCTISNPSLWIMPVLRVNKKEDITSFIKTLDTDYLEVFPFKLPTWQLKWIDYIDEDFSEEKGFYKVTKKFNGLFISVQNFKTVIPIKNFYTDLMNYSSNTAIHTFDDSKFLLLSPFNIDYTLLHPIRVHLIDHNYERSYIMRQGTRILPLLIELWGKHCGEISYLYLASGLVDRNQNIRNLASELWIKATTEGTMNHELLGQTLGKLEHSEYAPLKRFTDLIVTNMLNISTLHNQGLHTLLSNMIVHMNDEPIKGTKKLLEIYLEVLALTKMEVPADTLEKLGVWGEVKSLSGIVKKIVRL